MTSDGFRESAASSESNQPEAANLTYLCLYALQTSGGERRIASATARACMCIARWVAPTRSTIRIFGARRHSASARAVFEAARRLKNAQPILIEADAKIAVVHTATSSTELELRSISWLQGSIFQTTDPEVSHLYARSSPNDREPLRVDRRCASPSRW